MKMRALSIILCAAMIFSLTACGDSENAEPEQPAIGGQTAETVEQNGQTDEQTADSAHTEPEATEPAESEPEVTGPEETEPAETEPEETEPQTPEEMFKERLLSLSFEDGTIYNENGVTVTCSGFDADRVETWCRSEEEPVLWFDVSNQNPDNKKLNFYIESVDSVFVNDRDYPIYAKFEHDPAYGSGDYCTVEAGSESPAAIRLSGVDNLIKNYINVANLLDVDVADFPIETITIKYQIQVGSDSEYELRSATLKTSEYKDGDFTKYLGEKIQTVTMEEIEMFPDVDVYKKQTDDGIVISLVAADNGEKYGTMEGSVDVMLNGKRVDDSYNFNCKQIDGNYDNSGAVSVPDIPAGGWGVIFKMSKTDDEIRKMYEIPNSEPLEIALNLTPDLSFEKTVVIYTSN